jgi:hypothetical protein
MPKTRFFPSARDRYFLDLGCWPSTVKLHRKKVRTRKRKQKFEFELSRGNFENAVGGKRFLLLVRLSALLFLELDKLGLLLADIALNVFVLALGRHSARSLRLLTDSDYLLGIEHPEREQIFNWRSILFLRI